MKCLGCGADVQHDSKFCSACGAALQMVCVSCQHRNPLGSRFCAQCGTRLATGEPPAKASAPAQQAERRQLSVMFCDLVGSTAFAARLDPEELRDLLGVYHRCCAGVIERAGGFVAKYMGDGVLAYFGYPQAHEDNAERAVDAALALSEAVGRLDIVPTLQIRIGIATGLVVVGDLIGKGAAREQAVVGETPNLAARLQVLAEPDTVVVAEGTRRLLGGLYDYRELGSVSLKGFAEPVPAWQVLGPSAAESRFEALRSGSAPLVGREEELDLLLRRWAQAKSGSGRVVLISAEPGIGKSRLAAALVDRLAGEPHTQLRSYCSPHHTESALHPIISQLEHAAGFAREDAPEERLAKLARLLEPSKATDEQIGLIAALLSIPAGDWYPLPETSPQKRREKTFEALLAQPVALAAQRPVLMIYEDVHWIDPTSLELLGLTITRMAGLPILLLITARPEFKPPWPAEAHVTALVLNRLSRKEAAALIDRVAGGKPLPVEVMDRILAHTDGVPLFVEELTKSVLESDLLHGTEGRYALSGPLPPLAIPMTLHDSLMARLDRLAPAREVAQIGAALGREFSYELLAAAAGLPDAKLDEALRQLVASELVFCRGVPPEAVYTFKHALVQDAAYQTMLKSRRVLLHARIADVMERSFAEMAQTEPEALARHCAAALLAERAIPYWLTAGQRALQRSEIKEAIGHFNSGIALLGDVSDEAARVRFEIGLQAGLAFAWTAIRGYAAPEVEAAFARAHELCLGFRETSQIFPVIRGLSALQFVRGNLVGARSLALQLVQSADDASNKELSLVAHSMLGSVLYHMGDIASSEAHLKIAQDAYDPQLRRKITLFGEDNASVTYAGIMWSYHAHNAVWLGYPGTAVAAAEEATRLADRAGYQLSSANALCHAATCSAILRDPGRVAHFAEKGLAISKEHGFPVWLADATILLGWILVTQGKPREGASQIRDGIALWRSTGAEIGLPFFFALLSEAALAAGDAKAAMAAADEGLRRGEASSEHIWDCLLHCHRGDALLSSADPAQAETEFQLALAWSRERSAKWGELYAAVRLARLWRADGRAGEAHELLAPIHGWFTEGFDTAVLNDAKALLDELTPART